MKSEEYCKELDSITKTIQEEFVRLSEEEINFKPVADQWSIAQNLHHLLVVNSSYFPIFEALTSRNYKTPFIARFKFLVNFFGKFILKSVLPDRKKKIKTFPVWKPSQSHIQNVLENFTAHQEILKHKIRECSAYLENDTVIHSPANKNIVYTLDQALQIIIQHEKRHFVQAKELYNSFLRKKS